MTNATLRIKTTILSILKKEEEKKRKKKKKTLRNWAGKHFQVISTRLGKLCFTCENPVRSEVPLFIYNNTIGNYTPEGTYARLCLSSGSEVNSLGQSGHKRATEKQSEGRLTGTIQSACAMLCLTTHHHTDQWLLVGGNFFLFQAARQGSKHTRGVRRCSNF